MYCNDDELYHYGVLGMKWGRRKKNYTSSTTYGSTRKLRKAQKKYDKRASKLSVEAHNRAAERINAEIPSFNKKWKGKIGTQEYYDAYEARFNTIYGEEFVKIYGNRPV